jgi:cell division protease FtsH
MVMRLPEDDRLSMSKMNAIAHLVVAMGGRVAEEVVYGKDNICNGAMGDIKMATRVARSMVTEWGMSDKLGMIAYADEDQGNSFFGAARNFSEQTARDIDVEVKRLIDEAYVQARNYLHDHVDELHRLAEALLEYETLTGEEIRQIMRGQPIERPEEADDGPVNRRASVPQVTGEVPASTPAEDGGAVPAPQAG